MTSMEIVRYTLEYARPERVARSFGDSDFQWAGCEVRTRSTDWKQIGNGRWERTDEWGNLWARLDPTSKGEVVRGVLDDLAAVEAYEFPDYSRAADYASVSVRRAEAPDKWLIGNMPGFAFNIARKMRKLDQYLMDLVLEADRMHALHDRIDALLENMVRNYAAAGVDSVMFPEDWGTQNQTLISPDMWREEFFPRFVKLCGIAHSLGIKVFMHSCGKIEAIVPGLMEAGNVDLSVDSEYYFSFIFRDYAAAPNNETVFSFANATDQLGFGWGYNDCFRIGTMTASQKLHQGSFTDAGFASAGNTTYFVVGKVVASAAGTDQENQGTGFLSPCRGLASLRMGWNPSLQGTNSDDDAIPSKNPVHELTTDLHAVTFWSRSV